MGDMAAQLLGLTGLETIGIDLHAGRLKAAEECGVSATVNASSADVAEEVLRMTDGEGVEVTVEAVGKPDLLPLALRITRPGGEVILLRTPRGEWETNAAELLREIFEKGISLKGARREETSRNTHIALELIRSERIKVDPLITHVIKPERVKSAYEGLLNRKDEFLGVVIDWREG
ncbi:hypothetical protein DRP77_08410 [Candidatus Poribacteria bacterium]|nr:MAG: hypothetical protein DRP77_08410 [Candidatus Poribacteria bacterium]